MYLLYLDDSGSVENTNENYFVLGGICVPERSIKWLSFKLDELAKEYETDVMKAPQIEFHAAEIFGGRSEPWKNLTDDNGKKNKEHRIEIIKKVLKVLDEAYNNITAFACAVHKASYPGQDPREIAFEDLCSRFDIFLRRKRTDPKDKYPHTGLIIFDENAYSEQLEKLSMNFRVEGTQWRNLYNIREVPFFVDSKASRLIQLADHIAYAIFRKYNAADDNYYRCIEGRFDKDNGSIHGLVHLQKYNPNCTCPFCLTRPDKFTTCI